MEEKLNRLQFKFSIPENPIRVSTFSINRISKRSTVTAKTQNPTFQFEETHDLIPERSSRPMRQLAATCTNCN